MHKILVTGGCGFIGTNFINEAINKHNYNILNYDKLTYSANPENLNKFNFLIFFCINSEFFKESIDS